MKYYDFAATTPISDHALDVYDNINKTCFFNSGASNIAKQLETTTREEILATLGYAKEDYEFIFTSGGTEANNLAIFGYSKTLTIKSHFITTKFEHASVYQCFKELELQGHSVSYIDIDKSGHIKVDQVINAIQKNTKMIALIGVQNDLGSVQPIKQIFTKVNQINPDIVKMVDYVQGLGKVKMDLLLADLISISSHKIYGPKATGGLIKRKKITLKPIIFGGTNEMNMRAGLQSLPAQVAFKTAVIDILNKFDTHQKIINLNKNYFIENLKNDKNITFNGHSESNVVNLTVMSNLNNTEILANLSKKGFILSAKSADSAGLKSHSRSLLAIGLAPEQIEQSFRISFSHLSKIEDTKELVSEIKKFVK